MTGRSAVLALALGAFSLVACAAKDAGPQVRRLATGMGFVEGPLWMPETGELVFSDIPANRLMRWSEAEGLVPWFAVEGPNGSALDPGGALLNCSQGGRSVQRLTEAGFAAVVEHFEGARFNSPNDLAVQRDGVLWFTDPPWGLTNQREGRELPGNWVFRFDPRTGELAAVLEDRAMPNGIALSPDQRRLYVSDTGGHPSHPNPAFRDLPPTLSAYALENGQLTSAVPLWRVETVSDGMCVDPTGRIFATGTEGLTIWSPAGEPLGAIPLPERPANVCLGGDDGRTLFVTARTSLYAVQLP